MYACMFASMCMYLTCLCLCYSGSLSLFQLSVSPCVSLSRSCCSTITFSLTLYVCVSVCVCVCACACQSLLLLRFLFLELALSPVCTRSLFRLCVSIFPLPLFNPVSLSLFFSPLFSRALFLSLSLSVSLLISLFPLPAPIQFSPSRLFVQTLSLERQSLPLAGLSESFFFLFLTSLFPPSDIFFSLSRAHSRVHPLSPRISPWESFLLSSRISPLSCLTRHSAFQVKD